MIAFRSGRGYSLPTSMLRARQLPLALLAAALAACGGRGSPGPQTAFWRALGALCGNAYAGRLTQGSAQDSLMARADLVMHVRQCDDRVIRIPFHVGPDRSRTWVLTRTETGLRLKHDHRHEDGSEDALTQYGGDTVEPGTAERQEFPADAHTAELLAAAATNVWTVELVAGVRFTYALRREGSERRVRIDFDLTEPVEAPPPPWGSPTGRAARR